MRTTEADYKKLADIQNNKFIPSVLKSILTGANSINWGELGKQAGDWGGDYDVMKFTSDSGGKRDANTKGKTFASIGAQAEDNPAYDNTGRFIVLDNPESPTDGTQTGQVGSGGSTGTEDGDKSAAVATALKNTLRKKGNANLDELMTLYDQILSKIKTAYGDQTNRINGNYDTKVKDQTQSMNEGMYNVDSAAAASNLADSSYRSTKRGQVRTAADSNIKTLNQGRDSDLATIGQNANTDIAKYTADKDSIGYNRELLNGMDNESDLYSEVNKSQTNKLGVQSDMAKYGENGSFIADANKLGNYDTTALEETLAKVVGNASATASTKQSTVSDIIDGTGLTKAEKDRLKSKYSQTIG